MNSSILPHRFLSNLLRLLSYQFPIFTLPGSILVMGPFIIEVFSPFTRHKEVVPDSVVWICALTKIQRLFVTELAYSDGNELMLGMEQCRPPARFDLKWICPGVPQPSELRMEVSSLGCWLILIHAPRVISLKLS